MRSETSYESAAREIFEEYAVKAKRAEEAADRKKEALYALSPALKEVDAELGACCLELFSASLGGKDSLNEKMGAIREKNLALQEKRKKLLEEMGLPENATDPVYECPLCKDSGYVDGVMCACLSEKLAKARLASSGLGRLSLSQSFDTLDPALQPESEARERLAQNARVCREYAGSFEQGGKNLLLIGPTGLGKTHLSTAVALFAAGRGFDVVYESAPDVFRAFEAEQFRGEGTTGRYFSADLLILDDLGAEMQTAFTVATLYHLINTRALEGRATLISTNFTAEELKKKYASRITSRLFGEYRVLLFTGKDARQLRLRAER